MAGAGQLGRGAGDPVRLDVKQVGTGQDRALEIVTVELVGVEVSAGQVRV